MADASKISIDGVNYNLRDNSKAPNTVVSKTANGLCPQLPNETATTKYLRQDGRWVVPPNTTKGTTYNAGSVPANTTFGTNGSIKNVFDYLNGVDATLISQNMHWRGTIELNASSFQYCNVSSVIPSGYKIKSDGHIIATLNTNLGLTAITFAIAYNANLIVVGFTENLTNSNVSVSLEFEIEPI